MEITKEFEEQMLELGVLHLKKATKQRQDDEGFVMKAIKKFGIEEFEFASKRLRSEARVILLLAGQYPQVLNYIALPICQRYKNSTGKEVKDSVLLFSTYCMDIEPKTYQFMPKALAIEFYKFASSSLTAETTFYGEKQKIKSKFYSPLLKYCDKTRPEITTIVNKSK